MVDEKASKPEWEGLTEEDLRKVISVAKAEEPEEFDPTPYIGQKTKIETWEPFKGQYGLNVIVKSALIDDNRGIRASKMLNIAQNSEGNICWFKGSKTDLFMAKHKAETFDELINKEIVLITHISTKDGKEYLTFN